MKCKNPITIQNPKWNNDKYREIEQGERYITVKCGKCINCRIERQQEWATRIKDEAKYTAWNYFITLTYNDDQKQTKTSKEHIQKFLKRLRKNSQAKIKYFITAEYGPKTQRPHYHGILMSNRELYNEKKNEIEKNWKKGFTQIGKVENASINYVCKYTLKSNKETWAMMSAGIGKKAAELRKEIINNQNYLNSETGKKIKIPKYYIEKFRTEENQKKIKAQNLKYLIRQLVLNKGLTEEDALHWIKKEATEKAAQQLIKNKEAAEWNTIKEKEAEARRKI